MLVRVDDPPASKIPLEMTSPDDEVPVTDDFAPDARTPVPAG